MVRLKAIVIEIAKLAGAVLLVWILVSGIHSVLTKVLPSRDWVVINSEDEKEDVRDVLSFFGGIVLTVWIFYKIRLAGMTDEEKRTRPPESHDPNIE